MHGDALEGNINIPFEVLLYGCEEMTKPRKGKKTKKADNRSTFEKNILSVARMDRPELIRRIRNFKGRFRLDFTDDYLNKLSVDRLRHILLAALQTGNKK